MDTTRSRFRSAWRAVAFGLAGMLLSAGDPVILESQPAAVSAGLTLHGAARESIDSLPVPVAPVPASPNAARDWRDLPVKRRSASCMRSSEYQRTLRLFAELIEGVTGCAG